MNIIGLAGPAHVGKTTIAKFLRDDFGYQILSYASPLKESLVALTGLKMEVFTDEKEKNIPRKMFNGKTSREVMQLFGTEFCRNMIADDFWIRLMREKLYRTGGLIAIDDVRFQNEADLITEFGGIVVNLSRPGTEVGDKHASEAGVIADIGVGLSDDHGISRVTVESALMKLGAL